MTQRNIQLFVCSGCGINVRREVKLNTKLLCHECSIYSMIKSLREMHYKSGPAYDKFMASDGKYGRPRRWLG